MRTIIALIAAIRCPASGTGHDFGTQVAQAYLACRAEIKAAAARR